MEGKEMSRRAAQEEREVKIIDALKKGKGVQKMAAEMQVHRNTIWADLKALRDKCKIGSGPEFEAYRDAQLQVLERIEQSIIEGHIRPDVANAWRAVRQDIANLIGLNAPSKSVSVKVDAESSPLFLKFKKACAGLADEQLEEVLQFAADQPRAARKPERNESWFPKPTPKEIEG
jgi:hypothetical protein